ARLSHEEMPAAGSILHLYLPPAALHFFDSESGLRMES
ncbi:TPA: sn-glycerol-3-phosphate ABC transporter ATP-binding protein UgpC, partial [Yersinia enterocolitica]|nr:sn-glycerol-3-phosphate ABC transporter ATP-binding protein UgpC [Yersinia enterocolitica]